MGSTMLVLSAPIALYKSLPRAFWLLWLGALISRLGNCVLPMMAIYLTRERGVSLTTTGTLVALYGIGSLFGSLAGGALADRIGRKTTMVSSLSASGTVMLFFGQAHALPALGICLFLLGLTTDAFRPACQAYVADVVEPKDRIRAFSVLYWAFNIGFAVASVISGVVGDRHFNLLFFFDAATTFAFVGIIMLKLVETRPEKSAHATASAGHLLTPFVDRIFAPFLALNCVISLVFLQFQVALPAALSAKGFNLTQYGSIIAVNGFLIAIAQPLVASRITPFARSNVLALGSLLIGFGYALNIAVEQVSLAMLSVAVWTIGELLWMPTSASIVADLAPAHLRGRYNGANSWSWSAASLVAPIIGTQVMNQYGSPALWWSALGLCIIAALGHLATGARRREHLALIPGASGMTD
ncbi:MAG: MFS transporter [Myxococcaceae bacterium]|nr:MFS transporter [Myxococcaceae bacterium]